MGGSLISIKDDFFQKIHSFFTRPTLKENLRSLREEQKTIERIIERRLGSGYITSEEHQAMVDKASNYKF